MFCAQCGGSRVSHLHDCQSILVLGTHLGPMTRFTPIYSTVWQLWVSCCGAPSLLLGLASAVILRPKNSWPYFTLIWESLNMESQVPVFISPRNRVAQLYPWSLGSLYVVSYDSQGYGGGILTCLHTGWYHTCNRSKSKLLYNWQSVSQYILVSSTLVGLATRYYFLSECSCLKLAVLYLWRALSDERTDLSFVVEVEVTLRLTVSQSVCLGIEHPCGTCDQILLPVGMLLSEICSLVSVERPLWWEDRSAICSVITQ
jgi:hypothetical protein